LLTGKDGHHHIIPGYFASENHPALVAPNGARLSADMVDLLAGSPAPGQYAQVQPTAPADSIGKVEKVVGIVNVVRNGVSVALHVGDAVYKSDVIQTGSDSSCGIGFPDGTALSLVANTRMALNDYSFDAGGTSNAALFTLVEGTFAFVAGQVAHTGNGMKIATPVATMGIRGTTGYFATITSNLGQLEYLVSLFEDHNTHHVGRIEIIDDNPNSPTYGQIIDALTETGYSHYFTPRVDNTPLIFIEPSSNLQLTQELQIINDLFRVLDLINNPNPQNFNTPGSPTLPDIDLPHFTPENGGGNEGQPFAILLQEPGAPTVYVYVPAGSPTTHGSSTSTTIIWTATSGGNWEDQSNWSGNPETPGAHVEITPQKVTLSSAETVAALTIDAGGTLNIVDGGTLVVSGIQNAGLIQLNSSGADPTLAINGTVDLVGGGELKLIGPTADNMIVGVHGTNATLENVDNVIIGSGTIGQGDGELTFINDAGGSVAALNGTLIIDTGNMVGNSGLFAAAAGATLLIEDNVNNTGVFLALAGGTIDIENSTIHNAAGTIAAIGIVNLSDSTVVGGTLSTSGPGSSGSNIDVVVAPGAGMSVLDGSSSPVTVQGYVGVFQGAQLELKGTIHIDGANGEIDVAGPQGGATGPANLLIAGTVTLDTDGANTHSASISLDGNAQIVAGVGGGTLDNVNTMIAGAGEIGGNLTLDNEQNGFIAALGPTPLILDTGNNIITNAGTLLATEGGELSVRSVVNDAGGTVLALSGGFVDFFMGVSGGSATINGGTLEYGWSSNVNTSFAGSGGTLVLDHQNQATDSNFATAHYTGTVSGFVAGDGIVLTDLVWTNTETASWSGGILTISDGGVTEATIAISGNYNANSFQVADDLGAGGKAEVELATLPPTSDEWINTSGGAWTAGANWSNSAPPTSSMDAVVDLSGTYTITIANSDLDDAAKSLMISDNGATLTGSGTLTVGSIVNYGKVEAGHGDTLSITELSDGSENFGKIEARDGGSLTLNREGSTTNEASGIVEALGHGSTLTLNNNLSDANDGTVKAAYGGTVTINVADIDNTGDGGNYGKIEAIAGGTLAIVGDAFNASGAKIEASGRHSQVEFSSGDYLTGVDNEGTIIAEHHGSVSFDNVGVDNEADGEDRGKIEADGHGSKVKFDHDHVDNSGHIEAKHGGEVSFYESHVDNKHDAMIEADGSGSEVKFDRDHVDNSGHIEAEHGGEVSFYETHVDNKHDGTIAAEGSGSEVEFDRDRVDNSGWIKANDHGTVQFFDTTVDNSGGTIAAYGHSSVVELANTTIKGGTLTTDDSTLGDRGIIEIVASPHDGSNTTVFDGSHDAVTIAGFVQVDAGANLELKGTIDLDKNGTNGTIDLVDPDAAGAHLIISGTVKLDGSGTVTLDGPGDEIIGAYCGGTLDNDSTITGFGNIGDGGNDLKLVNEARGIINATGGDNPLVIDTGDHAVINKGVMEATAGGELELLGTVSNSHIVAAYDGGTVYLDGTICNTDCGVLTASGTGSLVDLFNATIHGGTVETDCGGLIQTVTASDGCFSTSTFDGVTIACGSDVQVSDGTALVLEHTIDNKGTITVGGAQSGNGSDPDLVIDGTVHLHGGGDIVLSGTGDNIVGASGDDSHNVLINADDISGSGAIGDGTGDLILHNKGTVDATGGTLTLDTGHTITNSGLIEATDGGTLDVQDGTIHNTGTDPVADIEGVLVDGTSELLVDTASLRLTGGGDVTLEGGGQIVESAEYSETHSGSIIALDNVDNTIQGAGTIGSGDGDFALTNKSAGTVDANVDGETLTIDTGRAITNHGLLEATNGGILVVDDSVKGTGSTAVGSDGILDFQSSVSAGQTFTFTDLTGTLKLGDASHFSATITDFSGNDSSSDTINLSNFNVCYTHLNASYDCSDNTTTLCVTDSHDNLSATLTLTGYYSDANFLTSTDGAGGTDITYTAVDPTVVPGTSNVVGDIAFPLANAADILTASVTPEGSNYLGTFTLDPVTETNGGAVIGFGFTPGNDQINLTQGETLTQSYNVQVTDAQHPADNVNQTVSVSIGGPGNDNFVFVPGVGADTIINFNPTADTIELDHFANLQNTQQLAALIATDAHGDAVIELGHGDSITLPGMAASYLQAHLQSLVHLH
jgi:hypothetical protein